MEKRQTYADSEPKLRRHKKKGNVWMGILAALLLLGISVSTAASAFTLVSLRSYIAKQEAQTEESEEAQETEAEDYVMIAGSYEVRPTTAISEAYRSGDLSALDDKQKETLDMAKTALAEMQITDSMTDFEKEKAVYDWMTSSLQQDRGLLVVIPTTQEDSDNPYGVLKYHNAVCVGYATTFRLFMQMLGIDCMVVHNTELYHTWNAVKLDQDWYYTDIYSDAGICNYANFNMTTSMLMAQQSWNQGYFPSANSLKYNMAYRNKTEADNVYELASVLRREMNEKKSTVMVGFRQEITEQEAQIANYIASSIDAMLMDGSYQDMPMGMSGYSWVHDDESGRYLFCVYMNAYNTDGSNMNLTDEQISQIQESVQNAFGDLQSWGYEQEEP